MLSLKIYPKRIFYVSIMVVFLSGCSNLQRIKVPYGYLAAQDTKIIAEDNSFQMITGKTIQTPMFIQEGWNLGYYFYNWKNYDLKPLYKQALESGAKKVKVTTPYNKESLYGVLAFIPLPADASGPGTRSFEIQIPKRMVQEAFGGRVSVSYEEVGGGYVNWILWLSDLPLTET